MFIIEELVNENSEEKQNQFPTPSISNSVSQF